MMILSKDIGLPDFILSVALCRIYIDEDSLVFDTITNKAVEYSNDDNTEHYRALFVRGGCAVKLGDISTKPILDR